jgi:hypothetical protein
MSCYPTVSEVAVGSTRRELKHLSTFRKRNQARDTPSSGERTGYSLNRPTQVVPVLRDLNVRLSFITELSGKAGQSG